MRRTHLLPPTRVHQTGGGGLHYIYRHHAGLRCSIGRLARGVDIKADGGYAIWHPAATGKVLRDLPLEPFPEWIAEALKPVTADIVDIPAPKRSSMNSVRGLVRLVAKASEGQRNQITFWAACRAGELARDGYITAETAIALIVEAATAAGLPRNEARKTAKSGLRAVGA